MSKRLLLFSLFFSISLFAFSQQLKHVLLSTNGKARYEVSAGNPLLIINDSGKIQSIVMEPMGEIKYDENTFPHKLGEQNLEFNLDLPEDWIYFIMDVDMNYIEKSYQQDNKTYFKFKNHKFYQKRDFYVRSSLLLNDSSTEKSPLLAALYIKELISNVNQADIKNPQYIEVKNQTLNQFSIEYSTDIEFQTPIKGNIISTLHFRKLHGF